MEDDDYDRASFAGRPGYGSVGGAPILGLFTVMGRFSYDKMEKPRRCGEWATAPGRAGQGRGGQVRR